MESNILNELIVVKRSGQRVNFNGAKVAIAIKNAFDSVYEYPKETDINKVYSDVLKYICNNYQERKTINVEDVQDIIENVLKNEKFIDVYNSFNEYRLKRKASREVFDRKQQHKFIKATEKLVLTANNSFNNPMDLLSNFGKTISTEYSKAYLIDSKYVRMHDEGSIYIHDLDYYVLGTTSSCFIDLSNIEVDQNYYENIMNILLAIKAEQHGDHVVSSFDHIIIPYILYEFKKIFKDRLLNLLKLLGINDYIDLKNINLIIDKLNTIYFKIDIFEKYIYNDKIKEMFKSIYDYSIETLKELLTNNIENMLIRLNEKELGINNNSLYGISLGTNNSDEGLFFNKIYIDVIDKLERLDNITTIYKLKDNSLLLESISRLLELNKNIVFSNVLANYNKKYLKENDYKSEIEYFPNGERILENVLDKNEISIGRMIVSKTSINLVRIALNNNLKGFYKELDNVLELVKNELLQTFDYIANRNKDNYKYLFNNNILLDSDKLEDNQRIRKVIKNGTLSIGYVGLKECICILNNKSAKDINLKDIDIGINILKYMYEKCEEFKLEFKINFNIFEVYDKDILSKLLSIDKSIYGIKKDVTDKLSYDTFHKIYNYLTFDDSLKIASIIEKYSNGGYYEVITLPKNSSNKKILQTINLIREKDIGYFKIVVGGEV